MKEIVQVRKVQITPIVNSKDELTSAYKAMRDIRYQAWTLSNQVLNKLYYAQCLRWELAEANPDWDNKRLNDELSHQLGGTVRGYSYKATKDSPLPSVFRGAVSNKVFADFNSDKKEVFQGQRAIRRYKLDSSVPFMAGSSKIWKDGTDYYFRFNKELQFKIVFGRDKGGVRPIVDRIISGDYKFCDSSFQFAKSKILLNLTFKQPVIKNEVSPDRYLGVDLGMVVPAYCAVLDSKKRRYIGEGRAIMKKRRQFQQAIKDIQKNLVFAAGSKGRDKKLSTLNRFKKRESNWIETVMHKISHDVVEYAIKEGCGNIVLEDLKNFDKIKSKFILRHFGYFGLQEKIKQKAVKNGINVIFVDPDGTSITCHKCGNRDGSQRDRRVFKCKNPVCENFNKKINADYNAAYCIAQLATSEVA